MKFKKFLKLSFKRKLVFIEAYFLLGICRALILTVPFSKISKRFGENRKETSCETEETEEKIEQVRIISWAINTASKFTPWVSNCFAKSFASMIMLNRRGISTCIYFGVSKNKDKKFSAHSWIRSGDYYVSGGENKDEFVVTGFFGKDKRRD